MKTQPGNTPTLPAMDEEFLVNDAITASQRIPLIRPWITDDLKRRVLEVIDTGFWTEGQTTREFEQAVGSFVGAKRCIAATSCTTGLEMALRCLDIGSGDEVIVPDYTYPATAAVVNLVGATAVIVDIDPRTMLVDYDAVENAITPATRAVIPVSLFGNPLDWDRLNRIREKHGLLMIEDAACALGSAFNEKRTGAWADISVFSHHPRKFITTGEGGTITTDRDDWADSMLSFKHFGMTQTISREGASFESIGTNYKLSNVLAAIGLAQMQHIDALLTERKNLAVRYKALLQGDPDITIPSVTEKGSHSYQTFCVSIPERDRIMNALRSRGIEAQIGTYSLHMHKAFTHNERCRFADEMRESRFSFEHTMALPLYNGMTEDEQHFVVHELRNLIQQG